MSGQGWTAVVLAAGQGTRMGSPLPKVLHKIAGRPLILWAVDAALEAGASDAVVVVGHGRALVEETLRARYGAQVRTVVQDEQRGTGHAVQCALRDDDAIRDHIAILYGDCPLVPPQVLRDLVNTLHAGPAALGLVTGTLADPTGYGRIVRDENGCVRAIVEHRDCTPTQQSIDEVNPGIYAAETAFIRDAIQSLSTENDAGELYLTDVVATAYEGAGVCDIKSDMASLLGVNTPSDLARCAAKRRIEIATNLAHQGTLVADPSTAYIDADCEVEPGAVLGPNVHLRGACHVASGATVDTGCVLTDVTVETDATLLPYSVATEARIGQGASVGPFAHLRPHTQLGKNSKVGNFSETKNTVVGDNSKINHLSYVGDGRIGTGVNIGAGTIFCNYDGANKHITTLEDGVFVGSDSQLVAPVTIGQGAYVASGTTVTKDVPPNALAVARAPQENKEGYASRLRAQQQAAKTKKS